MTRSGRMLQPVPDQLEHVSRSGSRRTELRTASLIVAKIAVVVPWRVSAKGGISSGLDKPAIPAKVRPMSPAHVG
jgi:hypothetical protein